MKKGILVIALFLGLSVKSFAATGSTNDGHKFFIVIVGFLLLLLGLLSGADYLRNNGKTLVNNARSFFKNIIPILRNYLNKVKSAYSGLSYS